MKKNKPLVSIIVPAYNAEKYIEKLLHSVLNQDYSSIELFVVNDGSTDSTLRILKSYQSEFVDRNIKYKILSQNNKGQAAAVNKGLREFAGDYITFIDADDYLTNDSISKRVDFLEKHENFSVVYGRTDEVNADNNYLKVGERSELYKPPRENLFIDMILERDYNWPPVQYLIRSKDFLRACPSRSIVEFRQGQNIQIFLPVYFYGKVGYINETLSYIAVRDDSHSRIVRSKGDERLYQETAHHIYVDTLRKIEMPKELREMFIAVLQDKYDNRSKTGSLQEEVIMLNARLAEYRGIKRAARLLAGNIKRRVAGIFVEK